MRNWEAYVGERLPVGDCDPDHARRVVRELAGQLEDVYRDALAAGADENGADAQARAAIPDWARLSRDLRLAHPPLRRPAFDRFLAHLESTPALRRGGLHMVAHILRDIRYAVRQLAKAPAFAAVAVLTLAVGIAAATAIFSVVYGVLLRPLPYRDDGRLVRVYEVVPDYGRFSVAPANFLDWRRQNRVFTQIAAYAPAGVTMSGGDGPDRVQGLSATADLFQTLGVLPMMGTAFTAESARPGAEPVVVLSYHAWQQRFAGDPSILERVVAMNGRPTRVIGVMPPDFYFPTRTAEFWQPLLINPTNPARGAHFIAVIARLRDDVDLARASTEMKQLAVALSRQYPNESPNESAEVVTVKDQIVGPVRPVLLTLLGSVIVVVLIACVNVANLLLVRASAREKEIAIRAALGAGRRRLLAQMLAESLVLAVAGGAVGVLLGYLLLEPIRSLGAQSIPRVADVTMNGRIVLFAAAVSCATALLFGIAPAWHASRGGSGEVLNERSSVGPSRGRPVMRNALLVTEVALSFVLLTGAMLLLRSFDKLTHVDPGFDTAHVLAFQVALPPRAYPEDAQRLAFYDQLATGLRAKPGVTSVGLVQTLPLAGSYVLSFDLRGRTSNTPGDTPSANYRVVSPAYFDALRVPLKRGRVFTGLDRAGSQPVAIVDEAFVRKFLPNEEPIGQSVRVGNGSDTFADIVGVVGDVRQQALDSAGDPTIYVPLQQDAFASAWVLVRTNEDPASLIGVARQEVRSLNASLPAYSLSPLEQIVQDTIAPRRFSMLLLTALAGVAVFLAAVGLYGVMAYTVTQRTREIGVRMAMGAAPADVSRMVVGSGMKLTLAGVVLGLALAASLAQVVEKMLFDIEPSDPPSYAVTIVLLVTVAALACYIPARRAMRIDPLLAIRQDAI